ncbi:hypothetical protein [Hydrogenimonas urashimensis]|uniref:hypothetical protein n=1 Tax=Hydrogenimonas urashimensis TaxID=2740515 RepID=UPI001915E58B|nr:hypothetical protein [Hydrogenimonas urashimensis]
MQRNIADQKTLTQLLPLLGLLLLYPSMESVYPILPPLTGIVYVQWREALDRQDYFWVAVWMLYAVILESVWGLPLYGIWTVMFVTFALFDPKITYLLRMRTAIRLVSVVLFDLLYLVFLLGYGHLMHTKVVETDLILLYYFVVDLAGVILF